MALQVVNVNPMKRNLLFKNKFNFNLLQYEENELLIDDYYVDLTMMKNVNL